MAASQVTPPPGFELEQSAPTPPPGFELEAPSHASAAPDAQGFLDKDIKLNSYGDATLSGVQSIGRGFRDIYRSGAELVAPPGTPREQAAASKYGSGLGPAAVLAMRLGKSFADTGKGVGDIPAALRDINQSPDPVGTYAKAAQATAGQGGAQALTAAATEGAVKGAMAVPALASKLKNALVVGSDLKNAAAQVPGLELANTAAQTSADINRSVTPELTKSLHESLDRVAESSGVPASKAASVSAKAVDISDGIKAQAQNIYQELDVQSGGRYQRFREAISDLNDTIRNKANLPPDVVAKARANLAIVQKRYAALQKSMIANGVDPATIIEADSKWAQAKSLEDLSKKLKSAESLSGDLKPGASSLDTGVKNMKPGRLGKALGSEAQNMRDTIINASKDVQTKAAQARQAKVSIGQIEDAAKQAQKRIDTIRHRQKIAAYTALGAGGLEYAAKKAVSFATGQSGH